MYAVRLFPQAPKVLTGLPERAEDMVWDVLDAAADLWGFRQWDAEDILIASVGRLQQGARYGRQAGARGMRPDSREGAARPPRQQKQDLTCAPFRRRLAPGADPATR